MCCSPWHFDVQVTRPKGDRGHPSPASTQEMSGGSRRMPPASLRRQIYPGKPEIFSTVPRRKKGRMEDEKGKKETSQDREGFFSRSRHDP